MCNIGLPIHDNRAITPDPCLLQLFNYQIYVRVMFIKQCSYQLVLLWGYIRGTNSEGLLECLSIKWKAGNVKRDSISKNKLGNSIIRLIMCMLIVHICYCSNLSFNSRRPASLFHVTLQH